MNSKLNNAINKKKKLGVTGVVQGEKGTEFPPQSLKEYPVDSIAARHLREYILKHPENVVDIKVEGEVKKIAVSHEDKVEGK